MDSLITGPLSGVFGLFVVAFAVILAVLWIVLPFALFGVKGLLARILAEQRRTNALLEAMLPQDKRPARPEPTADRWGIIQSPD